MANSSYEVLSPKESAAFIASKAADVKINQKGIEKTAQEILKAIQSGEFDPKKLYLHSYPIPDKEDDSSVDWIFVSDCLNYSFWMPEEDNHYSVELHRKKYTGYMALCAAITKALEAGIPITSSEYYSNISPADVDKIFNKWSSGVPIPLVEERLKSLHESGRILNEQFDGSFANCVRQAEHSAKKLLHLIVTHFPSFRDEAVVEGRRVAFYKRAQILVADVWALFKGKGLGRFDDIDSLTMFADYRVPQPLVHFGALEYSGRLSELLEKNQLLKNGDREEVEIRGCSIEAVERIRDELARRRGDGGGEAINSAMIDFFLWEYRRKFATELARIPYHKVRSIYY